jgi:hypothetical protein
LKNLSLYFNRQTGFIPVILDVLPPKKLKENNMNLLWNGWEAFVDMAGPGR